MVKFCGTRTLCEAGKACQELVERTERQTGYAGATQEEAHEAWERYCSAQVNAQRHHQVCQHEKKLSKRATKAAKTEVL